MSAHISHLLVFSGHATTFSVVIHGEEWVLAPFMHQELCGNRNTHMCGELILCSAAFFVFCASLTGNKHMAMVEAPSWSSAAPRNSGE